MRAVRSQSLVHALVLLAIVLLSGALYPAALDSTPPHVSGDEATIAIHAHALATTGRDDNGNRWPLFIHLTDTVRPMRQTDAWWQPSIFYGVAAALRVGPLSVTTIRLAVATVAMINIVLMYAVGRQWFGTPWYGLLASGMLALTPAHLLMGRQASDYFLPLPFVLAWLYALPRCVESRQLRVPALTGLTLGVGLYSYVTSWVVMPVLALVTHVVLWRAGKSRATHMALAAGFAAALLPLAPWLLSHPNMIADMARNYHLSSGARLFTRLDLYWQYFSPSYLLFSGGSDWKWTTREAGVFVRAFAILLPLGIASVFTAEAPTLRRVLLFGFFFAPLPIVATLPEAPGPDVAREALLVPFGVLLAVAGVEWLMSRGWRSQLVAVLLLVTIPYQFNAFAYVYFGQYRESAARRFDELNLRDVAGEVAAIDGQTPLQAVYFSSDTSAAQAMQWRFQLLLRNRQDLWPRTRFIEGPAFCTGEVPLGSLMVMPVKDPAAALPVFGQGCSTLTVVKNLDGTPASILLRRQ